MTPADLRRLIEAATKGLWQTDRFDIWSMLEKHRRDDGTMPTGPFPDSPKIVEGDNNYDGEWRGLVGRKADDNAALIVALVNVAPDILALLEAATAEDMDAIRAAVRRMRGE
jgi:hypothetical protein